MKDGKIYFIEVKNNTGRLTKGQKRSGLFNLKKPHNAGENVPNDKRSDPCMHGRCVEAEALSK